MAGCGAAQAAPYRPATDTAVLQRLPPGSSNRSLQALRDAVAAEPGREAPALELASQYLATGRRVDDPRQLAYAITALRPWTGPDSRSVEALVLAATAEQYLHRFDPAMALLDRALALDPRYPQALLVRANLLEVRGELAAARPACARLADVTAHLIAITCLSSVASRSGELDNSYRNLAAMRAASPGLPAAIDVWLLTTLADMADRSGQPDRQRTYLESARAIAPDDLKLKAAMADWLIAHARADDALALIKDDEQHEALLLRLAIAAKQARAPLAGHYALLFRERQALAAGEGLHRREQARFALEVDEDPVRAASLARENWAVQREPEDLRLLQRAARASGDRVLMAEATAWVEQHRFEDRRAP